jgi:hypothetical protein
MRDDLGPTFLPTFTPLPETKTLDDGSPVPAPESPEQAQQAGAPPESRSSMFGSLLSRKPAGQDDTTTRMETSSTGSARVGDPKHAAKVIGGLVGLVFVVAAGVLGQFRDRDLRRPTRQQTAGFSEPVARIVARRTDLSAVTPDLADVIEAGSAIGEYLTAGPIVQRRTAQYLDDDQGDEQEPEQHEPESEAPAPVSVTFMP